MELSTKRRQDFTDPQREPTPSCDEVLSDEGMLDGRVRLAAHAVSKAFARETVVLDLKTGTYHGLNPSAGRVLEVLEQSATIREAVDRLAEEYEMPREAVGLDVLGLVKELLDRNLVDRSHETVD